MADPWRSQADADGVVFGYLGVKVCGRDVWAIGRETSSRRLGPLMGACAGVAEPRRSWVGTFLTSLLVVHAPPKNARLCVTFADGTRYERLVLPWVSELDWPKIAGEVGRFNAAAYLAHRDSA